MKLLGALIALLTTLTLGVVIWLPMTWQEQVVFGTLVVVGCLLVNSLFRTGRRVTLAMMLVSIGVTMRYGWWRIATLAHYLHNPWSTPNAIDAFFMIVLLIAEIYSFLILLLGYVQSMRPLRRQPVPMPHDSSTWPTVDVFIPTYNEPVDLVQTTALAAMTIDWPADKLRLVILDDGGREELRQFSEEAGIDYVARTEHNHAKAGNINHALQTSTAEYIAIFDCDHIPTRSFLQMTIGWFLRDPKLGMLQTPHHFYSPDPVERNLNHFRTVPNEGELFYGVIQDGNDLWNATFFCGSCAVLRRAALDEIGGIAVETVTEDAHTSLRIQMKGWNTAYLNTVQAAGLATESVSGHVRQRIRWARGMMQILRIDNPLFAPGLKPAQRLCYLNAMLHFLYAAPRLIFLASPLVYLIFGKLNMPGYWLAIFAYAVPHLTLSLATNSRIQGHKRHSFWNEVYETILSPYILFPTWMALINPRLGKFNVTSKGSQQSDRFDMRIGWPFLTMLVMNFIGLGVAIPRYLYWNSAHRGTVIMNVIWTVFNILILGVAVAVCFERKQRRGAVRIATRIPVHVTANGKSYATFSHDISSTGVAISLPGLWMRSQQISLIFPEEDQDATPITASVIGQSGNLVHLAFDAPSLEERRSITEVIYSRADRWLDWHEGRQHDNVFVSFARVLSSSTRGILLALAIPFRRSARAQKNSSLASSVSARAAAWLILAVLLFSPRGFAATHSFLASAGNADSEQIEYPLAGGPHSTGILLNAQAPEKSVRVLLPSTLMMENGNLTVHYAFAANSPAQAVTVQIALNGSVIADLTPTALELAAGAATATLPVPADLFVQDNHLSFQLPSAQQAACSSKQQQSAAPWVRIDPSSGIVIDGSKLRIADDLSILPGPFVQSGIAGNKPLSFVFPSSPDWQSLQIAGVVASWFGTQAQDSTPDFQVRLGALPDGNGVVFLTGSQQIAGLAASATASLRIIANPANPFSKLLIFSAPDQGQLLRLAQSFASGQMRLIGSSSDADGFVLPAPRQPDDAPTWAQSNRIPLSGLAGAESLQSAATNRATLYLRLAPDLNFDSSNTSYLSLRYLPGPDPLADSSNIAVSFNGMSADSAPMRSSASNLAQTTNIPFGDLPFEFRNTLTARFYPVLKGADPCAGIPSGFQGHIDSGGSYLNLGNAVHLARLPDLQIFANAGFPFTRYADLSHTAVLLAPQPAPDAIALYLEIMSYLSAQTGYPALRVTVADVDQASSFGDKDLLFLGSYADAAGASSATSALPLKPWLGSASLPLRARAHLFLDWLLHRSDISSQTVESEASQASGLIEASASPFSHGHSFVAVLSRDTQGMAGMAAAMLDAMPRDDIHGRVSFWSNGAFQSFYLSGENYLVGNAPLYRRVEFWLSFYVWLPLLMLAAMCGIAAFFLDKWLGYKRQYRLQGSMSNQLIEVQ